MTNENLGKIPEAWGDYKNAGRIMYGADPQIAFVDNNVTLNGQPSIRLETHTPLDVNTVREVDGEWLPCKAGDRILLKMWIKTTTEVYNGGIDKVYGGARIGIDFFAPRGNGTIAIVDSYPHDGAEHIAGVVQWGNDTWVQKKYDILVPSIVYTKEANGTPLAVPSQATEFVCWMQALPASRNPPYDPTFSGSTAWFSNAELYINPTVDDPTAPPPTTTPTNVTPIIIIGAIAAAVVLAIATNA